MREKKAPSRSRPERWTVALTSRLRFPRWVMDLGQARDIRASARGVGADRGSARGCDERAPRKLVERPSPCRRAGHDHVATPCRSRDDAVAIHDLRPTLPDSRVSRRANALQEISHRTLIVYCGVLGSRSASEPGTREDCSTGVPRVLADRSFGTRIRQWWRAVSSAGSTRRVAHTPSCSSVRRGDTSAHASPGASVAVLQYGVGARGAAWRHRSIPAIPVCFPLHGVAQYRPSSTVSSLGCMGGCGARR